MTKEEENNLSDNSAETKIKALESQIKYYNEVLVKKEQELQLAVKYISQLEDKLEYMRIKNRLKRISAKFIPRVFRKPLKKVISLALYLSKNKNEIYFYKLTTNRTEALLKLKTVSYHPLISIIMPVYNVDPKYLHAAIKSVEKQFYDNWELCIADDCSTNPAIVEYLNGIKNPKIKITRLKENGNISKASNAALAMANGEYITLLDNDDLLTEDALFEMVLAINNYTPDIIYSDEDKVNKGNKFTEPNYKPDYSPDLLTSQNYICHLLLLKKSLVDEVGGFEIGLEGSQDYDLVLKCSEKTSAIYHIPKVLYHWRKIEGSTASSINAKSYAHETMKKALTNHLQRKKITAEIINGRYPCTYRVKRAIEGNPLVSIIIPFKDKVELLRMCIDSILQKSTYSNFEIIGISNNSSEEKTFDTMKEYETNDSRIKFYEHNIPFNYSSLNNFGAEKCKGTHLILLNNDIEIITREWIEALLEHSQRVEIGVVGAKLYYPNDTVQHAGVIIGLGGVAGHAHKHFGRFDPGYHSRLKLIQNFSALTAACFMVKKELFDAVGGLNEKQLSVAFNDVDFCLRIVEMGYLNLFTPYCEAYHHESISRGYEDTEEKIIRFQKEIDYIKNRHVTILRNGDPYYNPNLTLAHEDFSLR